MKTSKKTFAQKYSSDFENLVLDVVQDALRKDFEIIASNNTKEKSDGGFDGYCYIKSPYDEFSTALLEAKLRSAISDLPLSDFSKSVIIATNLDAACIIIGTNLYFSGNTIEQLESFIYNTGLEIRTIDFADLAYWMSKKNIGLDKYKKPFIEELKKYLENEHKTANRRLSLYDMSTKYSRTHDIPKIYGNNKKRAKENIISRIQNKNSAIVIIGEEGIGKKTLIDNIIKNLLISNSYNTSGIRYVVNKMDMNSITSKNDFVYNAISLLWGCDYKETVSFFAGLTKAERIGFLDLLPKQIVKYLTELSEIYNNTVDMDVFFSYLSSLYSHSLRKNKIKRIFYFYNLEYCKDNELFNFIVTFVRKLSNMMSIIICIPDNQHLKSDYTEWLNFCETLLESNNTFSVKIGSWVRDDAICYVKDSLGNTQIAKYSEKLVNYFGINPAFLSLGLSLVKKDPLVLTYINENNINLDESLDNNKLKSLIEYIINGLSERCIKLVFLMTLIGNKVNIGFICAVLEIDIKVFYELHNKLTMFFLIKHELYCWLNPMVSKLVTENSYIRFSIYGKTTIYNNIINNLNLLEYDDESKKELSLRIALQSDNEKEVYRLSKELMDTYSNTERNSKKYWLTNSIINNNIFFSDKLYNIGLRIEWLYASYSIGKNGENTDFLEKYLILKDDIKDKLKSYDFSDVQFNLLLAKYYHISAQICLSSSDYKRMQKECYLGQRCLLAAKTEDELKILSELCSDYAVSIKHIENIENCVKYLDDNDVIKNNPGVSKMPKYSISYHSHYASQFTGYDPQAALNEFLKIYDICKEYSKEAFLHNLNNIAAMKFILKDYRGALADAEEVYKQSYENNVSVEFGRCQNVLGCINWHNNDTDLAKYYFKSCYKHFEKHNHNTHLWAPLVNLAIVCYETNDNETCFYTKKAYDFLMNKHLEQIKSANILINNIPKIVVAILMILYIFSHINQVDIDIESTFNTLKNKRIEELYYNNFAGKPVNGILIESAYNCDGRIMLKV